MNLEINKYYFDLQCEELTIFFECKKGSRYLLSRSMCSYIPELPPEAREQPKRRNPQEPNTWLKKWVSFLGRIFSRKDDDERLPSLEHYSNLQVGFQSDADTLYFMGNGALIHFSLTEKGEEIRFYTRMQAEERGILIQDYMHNSSYKKVPIYEEEIDGLYPIEGGFIVRPGFCINGALYDMSVFKMNYIKDARSIDFVQNSFELAKYPEESRAFRELPSYFCKLLDSSFDFQSWEMAMTASRLPLEENCVYPFYKDGICIAELVIVNLIWGACYYPYYDSDVLLLRYSSAVESSVAQLVDFVLKKFPNIKLVGLRDVLIKSS